MNSQILRKNTEKTASAEEFIEENHEALSSSRSIVRSCFEFLQKGISPKSFSWLDVSVFVCALGDFLVLFAPVLRQIVRYLPHHRSENASKTHPKSSHDKFKTASKGPP